MINCNVKFQIGFFFLDFHIQFQWTVCLVMEQLQCLVRLLNQLDQFLIWITDVELFWKELVASALHFSSLLVQGCAFLWCGGIQTTLTTKGVSLCLFFSYITPSAPSSWYSVDSRSSHKLHTSCPAGSRRVAVFCLMQIGSEVFDSQMIVVDRSVTDICFEGVSIL